MSCLYNMIKRFLLEFCNKRFSNKRFSVTPLRTGTGTRTQFGLWPQGGAVLQLQRDTLVASSSCRHRCRSRQGMGPPWSSSQSWTAAGRSGEHQGCASPHPPSYMGPLWWRERGMTGIRDQSKTKTEPGRMVLTGWRSGPCSGYPVQGGPAGRSAASACCRLWGRRHCEDTNIQNQNQLLNQSPTARSELTWRRWPGPRTSRAEAPDLGTSRTAARWGWRPARCRRTRPAGRSADRWTLLPRQQPTHSGWRVRAGPYLSKEALPGAPCVQETLPYQRHKLLPPQAPPPHLERAFTAGRVQPVRLPEVCRGHMTRVTWPENVC